MRKTFIIISILVSAFYSTGVFAQKGELSFAKYLIEKKNYDEAVFVLKTLGNNHKITPYQHDSVNLLLGNVYYSEKLLELSIAYFDSVSDNMMRLHSEAIFFSAYSTTYLKSYSVAKQKLLGFHTTDPTLDQLRNFELSGIALLQRDIPRYDSLSTLLTPVNYMMDEQEIRMKDHHDLILNQPRKSPLKAALLSAIVPGAGKFYAGNRGLGVYTLLIAAVIGSQAIEGYQKDGPSSFRFIAYTAVFTTLYVGTIWGSAFTVKMKRDQLNETINNQILIDLHIPIRAVFH